VAKISSIKTGNIVLFTLNLHFLNGAYKDVYTNVHEEKMGRRKERNKKEPVKAILSSIQ
jgi:hypothetical protein